MTQIDAGTALEPGFLEKLGAGVAHLGVGSLGLCLAAALAVFMLFVWRRQPLASYRMVVAVLVATLLLPVGQWAAQRSPLLRSTSLAQRLAAVLPAWTRSTEGNEHIHVSDPGRLALASYHVILATELGAGPERLPLLGHGAEGGLELPDPEAAWTGEHEMHGVMTLDLRGSEDLSASMDSDTALGFPGALAPTGGGDTPRSTLGSLASMLPAALLVAYGIGLFVTLARTALRVRRTQHLLANAVDVEDPGTLEVWRGVLSGSPLEKRAVLRASHEIDVPMCFGLTRPIVLLPASGEPRLAPDVLACVLLHELVHLERRDTWVMLGQEIVRSIFWFHPVAWWLCKRIDTLRELSCDFLVVRRTGRRRRYATALVEYAEWMRRGVGLSEPKAATALLPWTTSKSQLARRIEMLVALNSQRSSPSRRPMMIAAGSLFVALWGGQLAVAAAMSSPQEGRAVDEEDGCPNCRRQVEVARIHGLGSPAGSGQGGSVLDLDGQARVFVLDESGEMHELDARQGSEDVEFVLQSKDSEPRTIGIRISTDGSDAERILVEEVIRGSLGERSGLESQDIITRIDGNGATLVELRKAKERLSKAKVKLKVIRDGGEPILIELDGEKGPVEVLELEGLGLSGGVKGGKGVYRVDGGAASGTTYRVLEPGSVGGVRGLLRLKEGDDAPDGQVTIIELDGGKAGGGKSKSKSKALYRVQSGGEGIVGPSGDEEHAGHGYRTLILRDDDAEGDARLYTSKARLLEFTDKVDTQDADSDPVILLRKAKGLLGNSSGAAEEAREAYGRAKALLELKGDGEGPLIFRVESDGNVERPSGIYQLRRSEGKASEDGAQSRIEQLRRELDERAKELDALRRELDELRNGRGASRGTASSDGAVLLPSPPVALGVLR